MRPRMRRTSNTSLLASCSSLAFAPSYLGPSFRTQSVFDAPHDVSQTASTGRIFHFAGAATSFDFSGNPLRHGGLPRALNFVPNVAAAKTEAVADGERILGLFCADTHSQVGATEGRCFCVQREINHVTVGRTAKIVL